MRDLDILQLGSYYLVHVVFQKVHNPRGVPKNAAVRVDNDLLDYSGRSVSKPPRDGVDIPNPDWSAQRWTYKVPNHLQLVEGDQIVVPAQETHRFKVAKVIELDKASNIPEGLVCRWIVCKVDDDGYWRQQKADTEALRLLKDVRDARRFKELQKELVETLGDDAPRIKQIACGSVAAEGVAAE